MLIDPQGNIFGVSCIILIQRVGIDYINVVVHDKKIAPQIAGLKVEKNGNMSNFLVEDLKMFQNHIKK